MKEHLLSPCSDRRSLLKNSSQALLIDNAMSQTLKTQQSFRRHFLINKAIEEGESYHTIPLFWKIPFLKQVKELDYIALASKLGSDYNPKIGSGLTLTYISLVKSMICTGILFVPNGFKLGGWLFSSLSFLTVAFMYTIGIIWLGQARDKHGGSYSDLAYEAIGSVGYYFVKTSIFLTQLAFFVVTCVFFNSNLQNIMFYFGLEISLSICNAIQICLICPLVLLKKITDLTITHLFGDLIILLCVGYIIVVDIHHIHEHGLGNEIIAFNPETFLMLLGMCFYSFEGVALIVPIKQAMKSPEKFWIPAVLTMISVSVLLIGFGLLNYVTFGSETRQIVTLNLPQNTASTVLILVFLVAVVLSQPMVLYPPLTMVDMLFGRNFNYLLTSATRLVLVISLSVLAVIVNDKADRYISMLGCLLCGPLAYIFPAVINLRLNDQSSFVGVLLSWCFIFLGVVSSVFCTYNSIMHW